jgi:hypothetical protein
MEKSLRVRGKERLGVKNLSKDGSDAQVRFIRQSST